MTNLLGILGGMGPLASAEFLQTIYEFNLADSEQGLPACIVYSNPIFPDRTETIFGNYDAVLFIDHIVEVLEKLIYLGANKIAICCITCHYFLPKIPDSLREKVISLIDIIAREVLNNKKRYLMLCTNGTRQAKIFQNHELWSFAEKYIEFPTKEDQNLVHDLIYQIKINKSYDIIYPLLKRLDGLTQKYQVEGVIAGCTEFHLINKHLIKSKTNCQNLDFIDPLLTIATNFRRLINE